MQNKCRNAGLCIDDCRIVQVECRSVGYICRKVEKVEEVNVRDSLEICAVLIKTEKVADMST